MPKAGKYKASAEETKSSKKVKLTSEQKNLHSRAKAASADGRLGAMGIVITFSEDRITHCASGKPMYDNLDNIGSVFKTYGLHWNTSTGRITMPKKAADCGITYPKVNVGDTQDGEPITKVTNATVTDQMSRQERNRIQTQNAKQDWAPTS